MKGHNHRCKVQIHKLNKKRFLKLNKIKNKIGMIMLFLEVHYLKYMKKKIFLTNYQLYLLINRKKKIKIFVKHVDIMDVKKIIFQIQ